MSLTDTARHWFWGCALATAASRSDVNVAMPHLRGEWSPTKAILRTLEVSSMRHFHCSHAPVFLDQSDALDCGYGNAQEFRSFPNRLPRSRWTVHYAPWRVRRDG